MTYRITFTKENKSCQVKEGTTIMQAAQLLDIPLDAPCGGTGKCGKCMVDITIGQESKRVKACQTIIDQDMSVCLTRQEAKSARILSQGLYRDITINPYKGEQGYLAAFDIGTTSVVGYLMDGRSGRELASASMLNPQSKFGADVISRCNYVITQQSDRLAKVIRKTVNTLLCQLAGKAQIHTEEIMQVSIVGNTCMHHLFLGIDPQSIVVAPYKPVQKEAMTVQAKDYDIQIHPQGILRVLPNIEGFVGADTVGCILAAEMDQREKMTLMIDIGTNGEIVLGNKNRMICTSTAAGPAFEGAKIACGMRGADGAIDHVYNGKNISWSCIGQGEPKGICGSGLMDAVRVLLERGEITVTGRLANDGNPIYISENVYLTQKDIREVQLAKGAMAAGMCILCKKMGIEIEDIEEVLIAGAFGNYMDPDSACTIGLIPKQLRNRITNIGNAAGVGAKLAVLSQEEFEKADMLAKEIEFAELALSMEFQEIFVEEMGFEIDTVDDE
ncbi:MAG: DUF4445 domain-containing protein [Clostridia bacterium]|nr:DUF4445 domain-containing protein [Clostridia bacterium]NCC44279.1 DUF4445 domain-containing protein [Clostridia bacterium]